MPVANDYESVILAALTADDDATVPAVAGLRWCGYSVRDGASGASTFDIVNGATGAAAGKIVRVTVAAAGSETVWLPEGLPCPLGISVDHLSGDVALVIYYRRLNTAA